MVLILVFRPSSLGLGLVLNPSLGSKEGLGGVANNQQREQLQSKLQTKPPKKMTERRCSHLMIDVAKFATGANAPVSPMTVVTTFVDNLIASHSQTSGEEALMLARRAEHYERVRPL